MKIGDTVKVRDKIGVIEEIYGDLAIVKVNETNELLKIYIECLEVIPEVKEDRGEVTLNRDDFRRLLIDTAVEESIIDGELKPDLGYNFVTFGVALSRKIFGDPKND